MLTNIIQEGKINERKSDEPVWGFVFEGNKGSQDTLNRVTLRFHS